MPPSEGSEPRAARTAPSGRRSRTPARSGERSKFKHCEIRLPQRHTSSEISQILERVAWSAAQASFVRCVCGVDKRQESSEDACRPCDRSAAASASSRRAGRHETSIDEGGEQAHRSLKQRGSPPLESRGSKHPPQTRRPQPLRPPSRRAGPRAVAAPSPAFSSRKVSQFAIHSTWVLHEDRISAGAPWRRGGSVRRGGRVRRAAARARV